MRHLFGIALALALAACGGGGDMTAAPDAGDGPDAAPTPAAEIDGPDGAHLSMPAGAGVDPATIEIAIAAPGETPAAGPRTFAGDVFAFTPHALAFAVPVTLRVPFDPAMLAAGQPPVLYTAEPGGAWTGVPGAHVTADGFVEAEVDHFSYYGVGAPSRPLQLVQIGVGVRFSCGLNVTGDVFCWGQNTEGEIGSSDNMNSFLWDVTAATGSITFAKLFVGNLHACGIATTGDTYCWGDDAGGEIGDGDPAHASTRTPHLVAGHHLFATLALGEYHTCGTTTAGDTFCWGYNGSGQLTDAAPVGETIRDTPVQLARAFSVLAAGGNTTCGTTVAHDTYCWGDNTDGLLGTGDPGDFSAQPVKLTRGFSALAVGIDHACGIDQSGDTWCWGADAAGQLGDGGAAGTSSGVPVPVAGTHAFVVLGAASSASSTCAITSAGATWCWGKNDRGQLGLGQVSPFAATPAAIAAVSFSTVSTAWGHGCGLAVDHTAYCWGDADGGGLGIGVDTTTHPSPVPVQVE